MRLAERYAPDFTAFYLEGTDTVAHLFMPFAPPALEGTDSASRKRFGGVVDAYYRHADELLGTLIATVNPTVIIVCSDHGFRTGGNRPTTDSRIGYGPAADWQLGRFSVLLNQCGKEDSNLHVQKGHQALNLARLPIPPFPLSLTLQQFASILRGCQ